MLYTPIQNLTLDDIQQLIENREIEDRGLEYKLELPNFKDPDKGESDKYRAEFSKDISAFANTTGGYIFYGIAEDKEGKPTQLRGIEIENVDALKRRLESILESNLEPRLTHLDIRAIQLKSDENKYILAIYVQQSWNAPHRVKLTRRFHGRSNSGVTELDVYQLRQAFTLSEGVAERVKQFQLDRINAIGGRYDTPASICHGATIILHIIPLSAFTSQHKFTQQQLSILADARVLAPLERYSKYSYSNLNFRPKFNLEGVLSPGGNYNNGMYESYTQAYRNGIIEAVQVYQHRANILSCEEYETTLLKACKSYLDILKQAQFNTPAYIFLSLSGIKDFYFSFKGNSYEEKPKFDRDIINLPPEVIESFDEDLPTLFKPIFDTICNACGLEGSDNYDENGISSHSI
jgi:hypothetical protein